MQTIWKFETPIENKFTIEMPIASEILSVQLDNKTNTPCIWALVCPDNPKTKRVFELFGTGYNIYTESKITKKYLGTYQLGDFVGHLFERVDFF